MIRVSSIATVATVAALGLAVLPTDSSAQKALVYCPPIDATGCDNTVSALSIQNGPFPSGVDRGFDGTAGTVNLASVDLSQYAVVIVPSLADDSTGSPYALLRDRTVAARLSAVLGRVAVWSGTPDQGTAGVAPKEVLLRNLAVWAAGGSAPRATGLVALEDFSENVAQRYGWLTALSGIVLHADTTLESYSSVSALTATATQILDGGGQQLAYANMASFGLEAPASGSGATVDAVGGANRTPVLITGMAYSTAVAATVMTDRADY